MKTVLVYLIFTVAVLKSHAQYGRNCFLNGKPVSCSDPIYLSVTAGQQQGKKCIQNGQSVSCDDSTYLQQYSSGQQQGGKRCFLDGNPVSCNDPLYLKAVASRQQSDENKQCQLNGSPVSCKDPVYLNAIGASGDQHVEGKQCFLNGETVPCDDPAYVNAVGGTQPFENRQCYLNGNPVGCNDPQYLNSAGHKQFEVKRCYLNGSPVSCDDPVYLKTVGGKDKTGGRQCFLNGNAVSCDDPLYLKVVGGQQPPNGQQKCFLNNTPVSCDDPRYVAATGGNKQKPTGGTLLCYLNGGPVSCDDPRYVSAVNAQNGQPQVTLSSLPPHSTQPPPPPPLPPSAPLPFPGNSGCGINGLSSTSCLDPNNVKPVGAKPSSGRKCYIQGSYLKCDKPSHAQQPGGNVNFAFNNTKGESGCNLNGDGIQCHTPSTSNSFTENPYVPVVPSKKPPTSASYPPIPKCGKQLENSIVPLIEKGDAVSLGDFPWVTAIYDKTIKNHLICSGSIITPYAVLSAAHCFFDDDSNTVKSAFNYMAVVGKVTRDYNKTDSVLTKYYEVERIVMEGFFGSQVRFLNDIAILQVKTEIQFSYKVHAVCVRFQDLSMRPGVLLNAAGWGLDENKAPSATLKSARFPYLTQNDCIYSLEEDVRYFISSDKFCVHHVNGTALNSGDSGGGLTYRDENDKLHYIVGIVSFKTNSASTKVSVITNVLTFKEFIVKNVREIHTYKNYDTNYL